MAGQTFENELAKIMHRFAIEGKPEVQNQKKSKTVRINEDAREVIEDNRI